MKVADHPFYIGVAQHVDTKIENTAEAIASYIIQAGQNCDLEILTSDYENVLNTLRIGIDWCADKAFMLEVRDALVPKQQEFLRSLGLREGGLMSSPPENDDA